MYIGFRVQGLGEVLQVPFGLGGSGFGVWMLRMLLRPQMHLPKPRILKAESPKLPRIAAVALFLEYWAFKDPGSSTGE